MKIAHVVTILMLGVGSASHAQQVEFYLSTSGCKIPQVKPTPTGGLLWLGECRDGYADGKGVLEWRAADTSEKYRLEAVLVRGSIQGEATLAIPGGTTYTGTFADGLPDGAGYFKDPDGMQYEGEVHAGRREGLAEGVFPNGNHYKGQWKDGKPDGTGRMEYMLGGMYEGEWKLGKRHGKGTLTYAGSGRRYVGQFVENRIEGTVPPPGLATKYSLKEKKPEDPLHRKEVARTIGLPLDVGYDRFTPEQKRFFNYFYPALEEGDEPPYPLKGLQDFYTLMSKLAGRYHLHENLRIFVLVGTDGRAESVTVRGLEDQELRRIVATGAGLIQYKPALCRNAPCKMMFPFNLHLEATMF